ncbi:MAG: ABC transporter ATP-binding protein [Actinomycetota bacterium]|nr:ABC transporter ATP-binding protein [Actinomycetota bacterium]
MKDQAPRAEEGPGAARLDDLRISFPGGVQSLRGVTLTIEPGEILGLVGESGSGKSVLGLALLGLLPDEAEISGQAWLRDEEMVAASKEQRRLARRKYAGAVFQDPMSSLNPTMKVGRQIAEAAGSGDEAIELLESAGVPEPSRRAAQFPHELSGGLRQRAMIAMAIARKPALVIADEPTTALDVIVQSGILDLFAKLRRELGSSMLFITHDMAVASAIADRVAVLYGGRLAEIGPAGAVMKRPSHPYAGALLAARASMSAREMGTAGQTLLPTIPGEPPDPRAHPPGCPFTPRCRFAIEECSGSIPEPRPAATHDGFDACIRSRDIDASASAQPLDPAPMTEGETQRLLRVIEGDGAAATQGPALAMSHITKSFSRRKRLAVAVNDVSLTVPEGGSVALVGGSGCGKTTLLRIAVGLTRPDHGDVVRGPGGPPQMVFQDAGASLTPWMTVGDLLSERLAVQHVAGRERKERIADSLQLVGLNPDVAQRRPGRLSGGQRQRVALARAVIVPPALLACDEPTSSLDVSLAATVINLLKKLQAEIGMALLFVTHDLGLAQTVAEEVVVMHDGVIVEVGTTEHVLRNPENDYTKRLLAAVPSMEVA